MNRHSNGVLGKRRTSTLIGMETTLRASDMPHSRPPMCVTWKAAPLMKTIRTCTAISVKEYIRIKGQEEEKAIQVHTNERDHDEIPISAEAFKYVQFPVQSLAVD